MLAVIFLFETAQKNLLLGFMPEPLGLLVFGCALIALPVGLRRVFKRGEDAKEEFPVEETQRKFERAINN